MQKMDCAVSITAYMKTIRTCYRLAIASDYLLLVEMAVIEASLRSLLRSLSHFMSLLLTQKMDCAVSITAYMKTIRTCYRSAIASDYLLLVEMAVIETVKAYVTAYSRRTANAHGIRVCGTFTFHGVSPSINTKAPK